MNTNTNLVWRSFRMKGMKFLFCVVSILAMGVTRAAEKVTFYHFDALGSPVAATDEVGNVLWRETYQPYGERIQKQSAASGNSRWYTGHTQDYETGLVYAGARYYDPVLGRFCGVDPKPFTEADPRSFNRYKYGNNNPYRYVDPDGQAEVPFDADIKTHGGGGNGGSGGGLSPFDEYLFLGPGFAGGALVALPKFTVGTGKAIPSSSLGRGNPAATVPYQRPSGATTAAQRESVQGKPCVKCGAETPRQVAGHKEALVKEHYETGTIDKDRMRSLDAVQPECPTCSAREGAEMSRYSREMKTRLGQE